MKTAILRVVGIALILSPAIGFAQNKKPTAAYYITKEEVDTVNKQPGVDRTIKVMDIGDQHFSVGIIHRGSTTAAAAPAAARPAGAAPAAPPANTQACGETVATVPPGLSSGLYHNKQTEGYYIVSGDGTDRHRRPHHQRQDIGARRRSDDHPERPVMQRPHRRR